MEESRWGGEKEVELKRMTDKIKNKCYVGIRSVYTTTRYTVPDILGFYFL